MSWIHHQSITEKSITDPKGPVFLHGSLPPSRPLKITDVLLPLQFLLFQNSVQLKLYNTQTFHTFFLLIILILVSLRFPLHHFTRESSFLFITKRPAGCMSIHLLKDILVLLIFDNLSKDPTHVFSYRQIFHVNLTIYMLSYRPKFSTYVGKP